MSTVEPTPARRLPWDSPEGKPLYLVTDPAKPSPLSLLADKIESDQIRNAEHVLKQATQSDHILTAPASEVRWVLARTCECLADVLRIAESRHARIPLAELLGSPDDRGEAVVVPKQGSAPEDPESLRETHPELFEVTDVAAEHDWETCKCEECRPWRKD